LVHPREVVQVATFACSVQVSGVRCQQLKSIHWIEVDHELDFHSPLVNFFHNPIRGQNSGFFFY